MVQVNNEKQDQLTDDVLIAIRKITQAIDLHSKKLIKEHGITGPQLLILREINKKEVMSVSELARATSLSVSTVAGILVRLQTKKYLIRAKNDTDKRRVDVRLAEKGRQFLEKAPQPLQDQFLSRFNMLDAWEQMMILSSLQRLVKLMSAEDIDVSPILASGPLEMD